MIRYILCAVMLAVPVTASAITYVWDRNTEADMASYSFYACTTPGCTPSKNTTPVGVIPQTAVGVLPTFDYNISSIEGAVAVTAKDKTGNQSGLSVLVPFDRVAPAAPVNLGLQ